MCLIIFDWQPDAPEQLVLLGNRDEFYRRPSQTAHIWPSEQSIIAGRDLEAGGTWLGLSNGHRFCTVTNFREVPSPKGSRSRGSIPIDFLNSNLSAEDFAVQLSLTPNAYTGFNALLFDGVSLVYASNRASTPWTHLKPGVYGLSNQLLDSPWPKLTRVKQLFEASKRHYTTSNDLDLQPSLNSRDDAREKALLDIMLDQHRPDDTELPDTGIGLSGERLLSTIFIDSEHYGTRTSSLVIKDKQGMRLIERNFKTGQHNNQAYEEQCLISAL